MTNKVSDLAINGGQPVRKEPLPPAHLGASVIGNEELELLTEVVKNKTPFRAYGLNKPHMVDDFEKLARQYFSMPYALATATGTGSFCCAMAGLGIGPGDEVIIPSFGWFTDFNVPVLFGALPVFADINRTLNMDPDDFKRKITSKTKAVMVVHFQGTTTNMDELLKIAREKNIKVIEDCAQSCGVEYKGKKVGSLGDVSCFSLQQNKIITTGDGGLFLAKDPVVFERAARYHDLGLFRPALKEQTGSEAVSQFAGCQFRMNEFTGAVALAQLRKIDSAILDITRSYYKRLQDKVLAGCKGIKLGVCGDPEGHAGISFYIDVNKVEFADWLNKALTAEGIRVGPPSTCQNLLNAELVQAKRQCHHAMPPFGKGFAGENIKYTPDLCPNTDHILKSMVGIGLAPAFNQSDIDDIAEAVIKVWNNRPVNFR